MDAKESNRDWGGFSLLEFGLGDVPQYRCVLGKPATNFDFTIIITVVIEYLLYIRY